jgi:hypothetical protein
MRVLPARGQRSLSPYFDPDRVTEITVDIPIDRFIESPFILSITFGGSWRYGISPL